MSSKNCNVLKHNEVKTKLKQFGLYSFVNQAKTDCHLRTFEFTT